MMHHPIHLHGHFFRLINGQGERSPLKHTVDVPPMGKRTIEFEANDAGDWFFHCHLPYHMEAGMARVITYNQHESYKPELDPALLDPYYWMAMGYVQNNMTMGIAKIMNSRNDFGIEWDIGLEHDSGGGHSFLYEIDATWSRYFNPNFSTLAGARFANEADLENRAIAGFRYCMPGFVRSTFTLDSEGDARLELMKSFQLTERLSLFGGIEYDTGSDLRSNIGAEYILTRNFGAVTSYDSKHGFGAGFSFRF